MPSLRQLPDAHYNATQSATTKENRSVAIERVVVIGTGTMGHGIAEVCALGGLETVLCGRTDASVEQGLERARQAGARLEALGLLEPGRAEAAQKRLSGTTDLDSAAQNTNLVIESIPEHLGLKQRCFKRLDRSAPADAILTTNTSGLSITAIASATARPERVVGMHWWNPPHLMPLVEVISGEQTDEQVAVEITALARQLGKLPVRVRKDAPGFIGNRLQFALLREAAYIVEQGIASPEDVDRAMRASLGLRYAALGPFETADFTGLDVVRSVMDYLLPDLSRAEAAPAPVARLAEAGCLGVKSGAGFYDYTGRTREELVAARDAKLAKLLRAGFGQ